MVVPKNPKMPDPAIPPPPNPFLAICVFVIHDGNKKMNKMSSHKIVEMEKIELLSNSI
jgi:hypothetical protein